MANRRFGGGSASKIGYSPQGYQGNKVSPWQGGNAPGGSGLLNSIAPQAQLALALSSLLQPQSNPPSLLSLNTGNSSFNQDGFGSQGRFDRGRDFRRPEPYKANQGRFGGPSWRDNSTRPFGGPLDRAGGIRPLQKGKFIRDKNQFSKFRGPGKFDSKKEKDEKSENVDTENRDEGADKKRDWKRGKKDENEKSGDAVDLTGGEEEEAKDGDRKESRDKTGRFKGVPSSLLHCFVCSKSMWDGESFQNHLKGKAHKQMIDSLGQSFQVTVNILRENMRLIEEKKIIELDRMSRSSRYRGRPGNEPKSHCNMCDLEFLGKIVAHRKTEGHQRLKRFLHPNCDFCAQEFPSRMEWLDHRLTPDHLRKLNEVLEAKEGDEDGASIEEEPVEMNNDPILDESIQVESEDPVLELTDDLKDLHNRIPAYKPSRPVGKANLQPKSGFYCDICIRFMPTEALSEEHLKSERHYVTFVEIAKQKFQRANEEKERGLKRRQEEEASEEAKKPKTEDDKNGNDDVDESQDPDKYDPEEACQDDSAIDNTTLDDEMNEVENLIKTANEEENEATAAGSVNAKGGDKQSSDNADPARGRRTAAPVPAATSVKNGAGPKSKTRRGGKN